VTGRLEHFGVTGDTRLDRIAAGEFEPFAPVPTIKQLRIEACIRSWHPVTAALQVLERRGVLRRTPGHFYQVMPEDAPPATPVSASRAGVARGTTAVAVLLEALRWAWAGWYQITVTGASFEAWRLDGSASMRVGTLDELRDAILADYSKYAAGVAL